MMADINAGPEILSWMLFANEPSRGHPGSHEKQPAVIIPNPNMIIKTEPIIPGAFLGSKLIVAIPNKAINIPEGIKAVKFINRALDDPVAPSSLINWEM